MSKRLLLCLVLLGVVLPSCQMEMGVGTKLNRNGSGRFTLAIAVDKEFIDGLEQADAQSAGRLQGAGVKEFESFFDSLKTHGWKVKKSETKKGDVALSGACDFAGPKGFDACLSQVSSADGGTRGLQFKDAGLGFDFGTKKGFFKTHTFFTGQVNLAGGKTDAALARQMQQLASQVFTFEVRAELPGTVRVLKGGGVLRDGVAVWSPKVGERLSLRAESDAFNPASLVTVAVPLLGLLALGIWALTRRRPKHVADDGYVGADFVPGGNEDPALQALEHDVPS
ncbi:MAG: hypothetical protein ABR548_13300 [Actinomycetota bacterium]